MHNETLAYHPNNEFSSPHSAERLSLFDGIGFNSKQAVDSIRNKYFHWKEWGHTSEQAILQPLEENRGDIIGYKNEYIMREAWLPNKMETFIFNGKKRIRNSFSNFPISEGIKREERFGAVADALVDVEQKLLLAPANTMMAMISPAGWSGMKDNQGREITYPDAQIYFFQKDAQNKIKANTLVLDDLSLDQYKQLGTLWGIDTRGWDKLPEKERMAAIVRGVAYLPDTEHNFETMVKQVQMVKGSNIARTIENSNEVRTFDEVYQKMKLGDKLLEMNDKCNEYLDKFEAFVKKNMHKLSSFAFVAEMQQELELTILKIFRQIKGLPEIDHTENLTATQIKWFYGGEINELRQRGGCAGGGLSFKSNGLGGRTVSTSGESSKEKCKDCGVREPVKGGCGYCEPCGNRHG